MYQKSGLFTRINQFSTYFIFWSLFTL